MSAIPHEQYVFGSHVANPGDVRVRRSRSSTGAQTMTAIREVPPDDELNTLCSRVAQAMPVSARTAVVLVAPPRRPAPTEALSTAAIATSSPSTTAVLRIE